MKRHPLMVAGLSLIGVMLPSGYAVADSPQIVLYDGPNFTGEQRVIYGEVSDLNRERFNDRVESMVVISGTWEVCADVRLQGNCQVFGPGSYPNLSEAGFSNTISSLRPDTARTSPALVVYTDANFGGRSEEFTSSVNNLIPRGLNDTVSSIQVYAGSWKVCADVNYRGRCQTLNPGSYSDLSSIGLQDTISSIELVGDAGTAGITLYDGPNFQGNSLALNESANNLVPRGFNDMASSIRISSGAWKVCADVNYRGNCQTLNPGTYSNLSSFGLQDTISSVQLVGEAETAGITLYEAPNFQGASLAISEANSSLIRQNFNDRAASLIISSGNWEVCEDVNYRGRCQRLGPGSYSDLNSFGLMRNISSIRPAN
jgi:hypothetical protein